MCFYRYMSDRPWNDYLYPQYLGTHCNHVYQPKYSICCHNHHFNLAKKNKTETRRNQKNSDFTEVMRYCSIFFILNVNNAFYI